MKKIILNQKSYLLYDEIIKFKNDFNKIKKDHFDFVLFPQILYLNLFDCKDYFLGAQNFYSSNTGSFTGEVNLDSLKSIGVSYVMLNQYERVKLMNESKSLIREKLFKALNNKFNTILFINDNNKIYKSLYSIKNEINYFLSFVDRKLLKYVSIAYEPNHFSGKIDSNEIINLKKNIKKIKNYIKSRYNINMDIYYSGYIDNDYINEIFNIFDGVVINKNSISIMEIKNILKGIE